MYDKNIYIYIYFFKPNVEVEYKCISLQDKKLKKENIFLIFKMSFHKFDFCFVTPRFTYYLSYNNIGIIFFYPSIARERHFGKKFYVKVEYIIHGDGS